MKHRIDLNTIFSQEDLPSLWDSESIEQIYRFGMEEELVDRYEEVYDQLIQLPKESTSTESRLKDHVLKACQDQLFNSIDLFNQPVETSIESIGSRLRNAMTRSTTALSGNFATYNTNARRFAKHLDRLIEQYRSLNVSRSANPYSAPNTAISNLNVKGNFDFKSLREGSKDTFTIFDAVYGEQNSLLSAYTNVTHAIVKELLNVTHQSTADSYRALWDLAPRELQNWERNHRNIIDRMVGLGNWYIKKENYRRGDGFKIEVSKNSRYRVGRANPFKLENIAHWIDFLENIQRINQRIVDSGRSFEWLIRNMGDLRTTLSRISKINAHYNIFWMNITDSLILMTGMSPAALKQRISIPSGATTSEDAWDLELGRRQRDLIRPLGSAFHAQYSVVGSAILFSRLLYNHYNAQSGGPSDGGYNDSELKEETSSSILPYSAINARYFS